MTHDRAARRALTSALAARFGEAVAVPETLAGIEETPEIAYLKEWLSVKPRFGLYGFAGDRS